MNYSVTRFTGIDYANKSARWDLVAERHTQESALATCKSLNLNRPFYHRVEVNSKRVELPRFTVIKPNMKSDYAPIVIPASFTVRKKLNIFLMTEFELLFFEDQEQFLKLFSDLFIYDFDSLEISQNEQS
jgi:hypothetical protein